MTTCGTSETHSVIFSLTINLITNTHYRVFCVSGHIYNAVLILRTVVQVGTIILSIFKRKLRPREGRTNWPRSHGNKELSWDSEPSVPVLRFMLDCTAWRPVRFVVVIVIILITTRIALWDQSKSMNHRGKKSMYICFHLWTFYENDCNQAALILWELIKKWIKGFNGYPN